jgi:hypothetical protein
MREVVRVVKLSKDARGMVSAMSATERKACLAAAKMLYRNGLLTYGRFNSLSKALQK